ncbi:hypothetical protein ACNKXS_13760 [Christiangramia marina]|uniref:hypothetical protein n=1 Tax=Christiangramia marina TaxID=409436 RepID=UPI003AA8D2B8
MYANNNGPNSPSAAGFEPVNASDMVNLSTGDLSYVLPVMDVEGYPLSLSYHAGIPSDMEASWVGLGWYLTPGAINRSVTNTPDDWLDAKSINFNSYSATQNYYGISAMIDYGVASVGVGMNWGGNQGVSGTVSARLGLSAALGNFSGNLGVSANASSNVGGVNVAAGLGVNANFGGTSISGQLGYSLSDQWALSGSAGYARRDASGNWKNSIGASFSENGFGIGGAQNLQNGNSAGGAVGMSSETFSESDSDVSQQNTQISLPLHFVGIPLTLGYNHTRVRIDIKKAFENREWGALYSNDYSGLIEDIPGIENNSYIPSFSDFNSRTSSMDVYSTEVPQTEHGFVGDYTNKIQKANYTTLGYDGYNVTGHGIAGNMSPRAFQSAVIFDKGNRSTNSNGEGVHTFWHHATKSHKIDKQINYAGDFKKFQFYFDGQFTSEELDQDNLLQSSSLQNVSTLGDFITLDTEHTSTSSNLYRAQSANYVEVFTNEQIANGEAQALITPRNIPNSIRANSGIFDSSGIGGYKITSPDGTAYHYSLPVYHYERIQRKLIESQEDELFNASNVSEKREFKSYATHWLLTAVTGSDYVDRPDPNDNNKLGTFNNEDYGNWTELEYGKWSDGFTWRSPYNDFVNDYGANSKQGIELKDKGSYSFGRKQVYYLDKINTRNRTALFVKELRHDAIGKNLQFRFNNGGNNNLGATGGYNNSSLNYTNDNIHVREPGVQYAREYSLKLSKIVLVNDEIGRSLIKSSPGTLGSSYPGYVRDQTHSPNWKSPYFADVYGANYEYGIHQESQVLDINDVDESFIQNNALKVTEFNHDYVLAKNSASSNAADPVLNEAKARLTLNSVEFKGKGGASYMPPTSFNYYLKDMPNYNYNPVAGTQPSAGAIFDIWIDRLQNVDSWGFMQGNYVNGNGEEKERSIGWSLKSITLPTGARIDINYEEDDYYTEAASRRFWTDGLNFVFENLTTFQCIESDVGDTGLIEVTVTKDSDFEKNYIVPWDFRDYFNPEKDLFFDSWASYSRNYSGNGFRDSGLDILKETGSITSVSKDTLKFTTSARLRNCHEAGNEIFGQKFNRTITDQAKDQRYQIAHADDPGGINENNYNRAIIYNLLANRVPSDQTGGGLRVKELITTEGSNQYKVKYNYTNPYENQSSGITTYAPARGVNYVPYRTELPGPGVMYEFVTVTEEDVNGNYYEKMRYRHHVMKPIFDIFNPDLILQSSGNGPLEKNIFEAQVSNNYNGFDGTDIDSILAKKIDLKINTAILGQIRSIEKLNRENHVLLKVNNSYVNGESLISKEPNKGYTRDIFTSMKTIFTTSEDGYQVNSARKRLSVSSRTNYNNMLESTSTQIGGYSSHTIYSDADPWLGNFRKSETTLPDGSKVISERIPAYEKYPKMGSKVLDPINNKNMLSQQAVEMQYLKATNKVLGASITTWKPDWRYRNGEGVLEAINPESIYRKHQNFIWKGSLNSDGSYSTDILNDLHFDWTLGEANSGYADNWVKSSETTMYDHFSNTLEVVDINGNRATTKRIDNSSKVLATCNAPFDDFAYSGAEYNNGMLMDIGFSNSGRTNIKSHTGVYSVNINSGGDGFSHTLDNYTPGKYKISVWADKANFQNARIKVNGNSISFNGEVVHSGDWVQLNHYINLDGVDKEISVSSISGNIYFDDYRIHPISSSLESYVYNGWNELTHMLGSNNLATFFDYDQGSRLIGVYSETPEFGNTSIGGFNLVKEYEYRYLNETNNTPEEEDYSTLSLSISINYPNDPISEVVANADGGSGSYEYRWAKSANPDPSTLNYGAWNDFNTYPLRTDCPNAYAYYKVEVRDKNTGFSIERSGSHIMDCSDSGTFK